MRARQQPAKRVSAVFLLRGWLFSLKPRDDLNSKKKNQAAPQTELQQLLVCVPPLPPANKRLPAGTVPAKLDTAVRLSPSQHKKAGTGKSGARIATTMPA